MCNGKPIELFRGDDTDAFGLRTITIKLSGDLDLTNAKAKFILLGYKKEWNSIPSSGILTMSMTSAETQALPLGPCFGVLNLFDGTKKLTVANTIPFFVTNKVIGSPAQEYDLHVTLSVDTEIDIHFQIVDTFWAISPSGKSIYPIDNSIERVCVPALADVQAISGRYTLADVKNLCNTILAALKV